MPPVADDGVVVVVEGPLERGVGGWQGPCLAPMSPSMATATNGGGPAVGLDGTDRHLRCTHPRVGIPEPIVQGTGICLDHVAGSLCTGIQSLPARKLPGFVIGQP